MVRKIQICLLGFALVLFSLLIASPASAQAISVPDFQGISTTNAWSSFNNYGRNLGNLVRKKKTVSKARISKIRVEFNSRYSSTYNIIQSRRNTAAAKIEAEAEARLQELYAVVDGDFESKYEETYMNHELEKQKARTKLNRSLKRARQKLEKRVRVRVGKGKRKRVKVVRLLTKHGKQALKRQTSHLRSLYAQDIKDLNDRLKDSEEVLEAEYMIELGKADVQLENEKATAYKALQARINTDVNALNNRKEVYRKHLQRLSGRAEAIPNKQRIRISPRLTQKRGERGKTKTRNRLRSRAQTRASLRIKRKLQRRAALKKSQKTKS